MATIPTTSQGVALKRGDGAASEAFTLIASIFSISGPKITSNMIDVTSLDDTAKQYIAGLDDGGEVALQMWWVSSAAEQQGLRTDQQNRTRRNFQMDLNDAGGGGQKTRIAFTAIVTSFELSMSVDNAVQASVTLKVTGDVTFTLAS